MNNFDTCAQWVLDQKQENNPRVLDYGCGAGRIVIELRKKGVNAFGCDVFYDGGDYSKVIDDSLFENSIIRRMEGDTIPFETASFDFVINKMVMEHVENLDSVLSEIHRVLKPGGMVLSVFPDKGVWYEGHCGIPFLHWFPKGERSRVYYALLWRFLGVGYFKGNKSRLRWCQDICKWLDEWTHYRTYQETHTTYAKYFKDIWHIEDYWFRQRLDSHKIITNYTPALLQRLVVRKLSTMVFVVRKQI